ncbi:MAG TPA: ribosome biogenesis GTP-binding protein YihA/YsxC [Vicinamibacterales bacterium]|nr:ribosome biogenesis GTP-binding protein YihA/YsxC [Vicinamibacterales bacterium]
MKVISAEFVTSAAGARDIPRDGLPQIALVGRSNVGKSTLLNALTGRRIAHTSGSPGKTRLANLYRVQVQGGRPDASGALSSWRLYLVDLPGYGYAKGGKDALGEFERVTSEFFGASARVPRDGTLPAVLLIVDARHPGLDSDAAAREWIDGLGLPYAVVATKMDKLSRSERGSAARAIARHVNGPVLPVSADTGEGLDDLWKQIVKLASR